MMGLKQCDVLVSKKITILDRPSRAGHRTDRVYYYPSIIIVRHAQAVTYV